MNARNDAWFLTLGKFERLGDTNQYRSLTCDSVQWDPTTTQELGKLTGDQRAEANKTLTCENMSTLLTETIRTRPVAPIPDFSLVAPYRRWRNFAGWVTANSLTGLQQAALAALGKKDVDSPNDLMIASGVTQHGRTFPLGSTSEIKAFMKDGLSGQVFPAATIEGLTAIDIEPMPDMTPIKYTRVETTGGGTSNVNVSNFPTASSKHRWPGRFDAKPVTRAAPAAQAPESWWAWLQRSWMLVVAALGLATALVSSGIVVYQGRQLVTAATGPTF